MATLGNMNTAAARRGTPAGAAAALGSPVDRFLMNAMRFMGQPYKWGGGHGGTMRGPGPVDCSGLVQQAARMAGLNFDGTAAIQQRRAKPVAMNALKPGDLVFRGNPASHVGIYIGDGKVLHSPKTGDVVKITSVDRFTSAGRPAAFEGIRPNPLAPVAPVAPGRRLTPVAPPVAPPKLVGPGEPSALDLPPAPLRPGAPVPSYRERFGHRGYVKDGADPALLELARAAVAKAPELARTPLGQAIADGRLSPDDVKTLQQFLEARGFSVGDTGVDGKYGPRTHRALAAFLEGREAA